MKEHLTPVLLGADLGCYSLARSFYEAYGVTSYAFGREALGAVRHSKFLRFETVEGMDDPDILRMLLRDLAARGGEATRLLLPCTDAYAAALMRERESLESDYVLPLPPNEALPLFDKAAFYRLAAEWELPIPKMVELTAPPSYRRCRELAEELGTPFVIKPASSISYWRHPFAGMEKDSSIIFTARFLKSRRRHRPT